LRKEGGKTDKDGMRNMGREGEREKRSRGGKDLRFCPRRGAN
jgi:hypothetical protein